jgi:hypothetical protein
MDTDIVEWLHIASLVVAVAAAIAAVTPTPADDAILYRVRQVIDIVAFNWGHAKNAKRPDDRDGL